MLNLEQKKKVLDFVANFSAIAQKESWTSSYDKDTDSIAIISPNLSVDAQKRYLDDEFAFYINSKNQVQGLFIEYFLANFLSHHEGVKNLKADINREIKNSEYQESAVVQLETAETKKIIPELETVLINSLLPSNS